MTRELTQARALELLDYVPETGWLTWRVPLRGTRAGDRAGGVHIDRGGYASRIVMVDGRRYSASRVIWLMVTGAFPKHDIQHLDRDGLNDRLENLREATPSQIAINRSAPRNRVGVRGVFSERNGYRALIKVNHKLHYLGYFRTVEEASAAYQAARLKFFGPDFGKLPWSTPRITEAVHAR